VREFIKAAEPDRHGACLVFLVATGMRPGELIALRWAGIDFEARLAKIERALTRVPKESGWRVKAPKTAAGRRVIVLDETALRVLRQRRKWQAEDRLPAGPVWQDHDLVFATEIGTPLHVGNLGARHFKRLLGTAKIPTTFRLYDLRHRYGTRMVEQGTDAKTVAELMGHANVTLTLSTYTHPNLEMKRRAVARLEESLSGASRRTCRPEAGRRSAVGTVLAHLSLTVRVARGRETAEVGEKMRFLEWPGTELNRRHADFQSAALPTELPGRGRGSGAGAVNGLPCVSQRGPRATLRARAARPSRSWSPRSACRSGR